MNIFSSSKPKAPKVEAEDSTQYKAYLAEAISRSESLSNLTRAGCVTMGTDLDGNPAILLIPYLGLPKVYLEGENEATMIRNVMLLFIKEADQIVRAPYSLIYGHTQLSLMGQRELILNTYNMLPRRYKKNLKNLYIVHPSLSVKLFFEFAKLFLSSKFFKKLHKLKNISSLQDIFSNNLIHLPPPFLMAEDEDNNKSGTPKVLPLADMYCEELSAPRVIYDCISHIRKNGLDKEGIFRVPGNTVVSNLALNRMQNLSDLSKIIIGDSSNSSSESSISTDTKSYNFSNLYVKDVFDAASIMNKMLNSIPTPLIPFDKYDSIIIFGCMLEVSLADIIENEKFINKIKSEITTLPKPHAKTLELLSKFLNEISCRSDVNKMTPDNLAIVFGPTVFRSLHQIPEIPLALKHIKVSQAAIKVLMKLYAPTAESTVTCVSPSSSSSSISPDNGPVSLENAEKSIADRLNADMARYSGNTVFSRGGRRGSENTADKVE